MAELARQTFALGQLALRHWRRSALLAGRTAGKSVGRGAGLLLRLLFLGYMVRTGLALGASLAKLDGVDRAAGLALAQWGELLVALGAGALALAPTFRGRPTPLRSPLLLQLPTSIWARLFLGSLEQVPMLAIWMPFFVAAAPEAPRSTAILSAWLILLLGFTAGVTAVRASTLRFTPYTVARWAQTGGTVCLLVGLGGIAAPFLHPHLLARGPLPLTALARALAAGDRGWSPLAELVGLLGLWAGLLALVERQGLEELDATPLKSPKRDDQVLSLSVVERRIGWREAGLRMLIVGAAFPTVLLGAGLYYLRHVRASAVTAGIEGTLGFLVAHMGSSLVLTRASRATDRDARARPLLASLPLVPADTLEGKTIALLPFALVPMVGYLPALLFVPQLLSPWRVPALCLGLVLTAQAGPAIAFLTNGLGAPSARTLGTSGNLASLLVRFPLLLVAFTPGPLAAATALGILAAVTFEAKRAAALSVRWLDDSGDALVRETPVWPALLTLAAFFALQAATAQFAATFFPDESPATQLPLAYAVSGAALVLMTLTGRRSLPPLRLWPKQSRWLLLGPALGAATGALGLAYLHLLAWLGAAPGAGLELPATLPVILMAVVAAPLAEETFFRGWLQEAMRVELPERRRWLSVGLSAVAFALVHPPQGFPVIFAFGVIAGLLFWRSGALLPGMLAHAAHNGIAAWLTAHG